MSWFNSLSKMWQIIIVIAIILLIVYLYRQYGYKIKSLFQTKEITPSNVVLPDGSVVVVSSSADIPQAQRQVLETLAGQIKNDLYGINITHDMDLYKRASVLSDAEIDYLASYYKRNLTNGTSLFEDMDSELVSCFVQDCTGWQALILKLEKTGNR